MRAVSRRTSLINLVNVPHGMINMNHRAHEMHKDITQTGTKCQTTFVINRKEA